MKGVLHTSHGILFPLAIIVFLTAIIVQDFTIAVWAIFGMYALNVLYACFDIRERILFLFLHLGIGLFWLTRPFFSFIDPERTWLFIASSTTEFVLWIIFLTLAFLFFGSSFSTLLKNNKPNKHELSLSSLSVAPKVVAVSREKNWFNSKKIVHLRRASLIVFLICLVGSFALGYQKLRYMHGLHYEEYYLTSLTENTSLWVRTLATMAPYALCAYLATMPKKTPATLCMILNIATTVPMLIIGSRGDFVVAFLLLFLYYLLRNTIEGKNTWIGRKEKLILAVGLPLGIFVMGLWTYVRAGSAAQPEGFFAQIVDAFYKQGVTFSILGRAYEVTPQIQSLGYKTFSLGPLIGYITQGPLGQYILGSEFLGHGNNAIQALKGHSYAHTMSYFAHHNYLGGEGYGSSYLLELYTDFGFAGIVIFSFILGMLSNAIARNIGKNWFGGTFALIVSMSFFHMPRGNAIEWAAVLWTPQFWMTFIVIATVTLLLFFAGALKIPSLVVEKKFHCLTMAIPRLEKKTDLYSVFHDNYKPYDVCCVKNRIGLRVIRKEYYHV